MRVRGTTRSVAGYGYSLQVGVTHPLPEVRIQCNNNGVCPPKVSVLRPLVCAYTLRLHSLCFRVKVEEVVRGRENVSIMQYSWNFTL